MAKQYLTCVARLLADYARLHSTSSLTPTFFSRPVDGRLFMSQAGRARSLRWCMRGDKGWDPPPPRFAHRRLNRHRGGEGQIRTRYASTTSIVLNPAWMAVSSERFCLLGRLARGLLENLVPEAWTLPPRVISDEQKRCHESWQKKRTFPRIMMFVTKRDVENCRKNRKIVVTIRDKP